MIQYDTIWCNRECQIIKIRHQWGNYLQHPGDLGSPCSFRLRKLRQVSSSWRLKPLSPDGRVWLRCRKWVKLSNWGIPTLGRFLQQKPQQHQWFLGPWVLNSNPIHRRYMDEWWLIKILMSFSSRSKTRSRQHIPIHSSCKHATPQFFLPTWPPPSWRATQIPPGAKPRWHSSALANASSSCTTWTWIHWIGEIGTCSIVDGKSQ